MTYRPPDSIIDHRLARAFPTGQLRQLARSTGLVKRQRKLDAAGLFCALTLGFAVGEDRSIEALRQSYLQFVGGELSLTYASFHGWFASSLPAFFREDLDRFPEWLLAVGAALASFNPIYAQGITVAAFEALVLHHALADGVDDLATRFFGAAASVVDTAWSLGVGPDFEFPETDGPRPSGGRIAGWYVSRLRRRARSDPVLTEALTRVIHFERPPSSLFHPRVMWRVLSPVAGWFGSAEPESNTAGVTVPPNEE